VLDIASRDLGGPAWRKFDLEAWMPGRGESGEWGEVTSTSNCTDYQARRLDIRYRTPGQKGTSLVHTLNGTAIAIGRAMIAILENPHQPNGSIRIPGPLVPWMGKDLIGERPYRFPAEPASLPLQSELLAGGAPAEVALERAVRSHSVVPRARCRCPLFLRPHRRRSPWPAAWRGP
jgi:Seryl-tRNA synthetase